MSKLIDKIRAILVAIDFPFDSLPRAWALRTPKVIAALGNLKPADALTDVRVWGDAECSVTGSRRLISWLNDNWDEKISSGSYDEVRRRCVKFLVEAGVAMKDPDDPLRAPNSPSTGYALSSSFGRLIRSYETPVWRRELQRFGRENGSLRKKLREERIKLSVAIVLPNGAPLTLSPGKHNRLQAAIIADFLPQFVKTPEVIYIADALSRQLYKNDDLLAEVGLFQLDHRLLPDVVVLDRKRGWLLIIEAVATSGHISPIRKVELSRLLSNCRFPPVFVSAFPNYATFSRFADDIAWETEVWVADHPTHMIHFNGERFLGPYSDT